MSIDIEVFDTARRDDWNDLVERAPHATPFHRFETIETAAAHSGTEPVALAGYKGQEPTGLFPAYGRTVAGVGTVFSPPPGLLLPYGGPLLLNVAGLSQRKVERRHQRFLDGCLDLLGERFGYRYAHVRATPGYDDLRPLQWADFEVSPGYTYVVDLDRSEDDMLASFSSDARKNVRGADEDAYEIREGGGDAVRAIVEMVAERYAEQDETYDLTPEFAVDLYDALPEGTVRPFVCRVDGDLVGGVLAIDGGDTIYRWQGAADFDCDLPVNDLLDWHLMCVGHEQGTTGYDLVGANTARLNRYKAKFGPTLVPYYVAEYGNPLVRAAAHLYKQFG